MPLVDFINTGMPKEINLVCRTESQSLYVDCVTDTDIPAGTEVHLAGSLREPDTDNVLTESTSTAAHALLDCTSCCGRMWMRPAQTTRACCSTLDLPLKWYGDFGAAALSSVGERG